MSKNHSSHVRMVDPRHEQNMHELQEILKKILPSGAHYAIVLIDGPESSVRQASWATSMNAGDVKTIFSTLGERIDPQEYVPTLLS